MQKMYMNLKVGNIEKSRSFYKGLGFDAIEMYNTEKSSVYRMLDDCFLMVYETGALDHHKNIPGVDMKTYQNSSFSLAADSIAEIDEMINKVKALGGHVYPEPIDNEFMYGHGFVDMDGNIWDLFLFKETKDKV
ncbi:MULTISPECIES: VOC family protein [unclassified Fusibacter]|uniref:VOC family protein n=1 Tax=unclassified Fusibacter TaxID=2624464 RepID=UPI00101184C6|nr:MULTISPECIES: VOC family protein [unclassified Fusibacter]MCK8061100.1 VOC family protein [Fusibacter sp. A2]NPE23364.1 hypothetical protein [Fusibacter sp. A1]RXV59409.1 hypothetical protein DWB64_16220 [Fusibacter sp. A1]